MTEEQLAHLQDEIAGLQQDQNRLWTQFALLQERMPRKMNPWVRVVERVAVLGFIITLLAGMSAGWIYSEHVEALLRVAGDAVGR